MSTLQPSAAPLNFDDLSIREQRFTLLKRQYVVREASEHAFGLHTNARARAMKINDNKIAGFNDVADADIVLVAACLWEIKNEKEVALNQSDVRALPSRAVRKLVQWIKDNSDMDQFEDTEDGLQAQIALLQERLANVRRLKGEGNIDPRLSTDPNDPNAPTPATTGT